MADKEKIKFRLGTSSATKTKQAAPKNAFASELRSEAEKRRAKELNDELEEFTAYFGANDDDKDEQPRHRHQPGTDRGSRDLAARDKDVGSSHRRSNEPEGFGDMPSMKSWKAQKIAAQKELQRQEHEHEVMEWDVQHGIGASGTKRDHEGNEIKQLKPNTSQVPVSKESLDTAYPRSTIICHNLPPTTTKSQIKKLLPGITIDQIEILSRGKPTETDRLCLTAIVWVDRHEKNEHIQKSIEHFSKQYLGYGYQSRAFRGFPSTLIKEKMNDGQLDELVRLHEDVVPFDAKSLNNSNNQNTAYNNDRTRPRVTPKTIVAVDNPAKLEDLRNIHRVIEIIADAGDEAWEVEQALLTSKQLAVDPSYSWLYDGRSELGRYYRWRLWDVVFRMRPESLYQQPRSTRAVPLPKVRNVSQANMWKDPPPLKFEKVIDIQDLAEDSDYSDDENSDIGESEGADSMDLQSFGPEQKAKLIHALEEAVHQSGREDDTVHLDNASIGRITSIGMRYSKHAMDEIVELLVSNVANPLASAHFAQKAMDGLDLDSTEQADTDELHTKRLDEAYSHVAGLVIIHDVLVNAPLANIHSTTYGQAFARKFKANQTFTRLSTIDKELSLGLMRKSKWRNAIHHILRLWHDRNLLPGAKELLDEFERPITEEKQRRLAEEQQRQKSYMKNKPQADEGLPAQRGGNASAKDSMGKDGSQHSEQVESSQQDVVSKTYFILGGDGSRIDVPETDFESVYYERDVDFNLLSRDDKVFFHYFPQGVEAL